MVGKISEWIIFVEGKSNKNSVFKNIVWWLLVFVVVGILDIEVKCC